MLCPPTELPHCRGPCSRHTAHPPLPTPLLPTATKPYCRRQPTRLPSRLRQRPSPLQCRRRGVRPRAAGQVDGAEQAAQRGAGDRLWCRRVRYPAGQPPGAVVRLGAGCALHGCGEGTLPGRPHPRQPPAVPGLPHDLWIWPSAGGAIEWRSNQPRLLKFCHPKCVCCNPTTLNATTLCNAPRTTPTAVTAHFPTSCS